MTTCPHTAVDTLPAKHGSSGPLFSVDEVKRRARRFLSDPVLPGDRRVRVAHVLRSLDEKGTYQLTGAELEHGLKTAWKNEPRCVRRGTYSMLKQLDWDGFARIDASRATLTAERVVAAFGAFLREATNGGRLKPTIMVFPPDAPNGPRLRIWNDQLIRYAGEARPDGSVLGDPRHVDLTAALRDLGWTEPVGRQTVLPVAFQLGAGPPAWAVLPRADILEVPLRHPDFSWLRELDIVWHALPAISRMVVVVGGLVHPAIFSGWYVASEILENLYRYGVLHQFAERLGMDFRDRFWINRIEPIAFDVIMHSFRSAGVMIEDPRSADGNLRRFVDRETSAGRVLRGDKSKLVLAGATPDMHARAAEFLPPDPNADPGFHYLPDAWKSLSA
ncbi:nitric oxide synthase oxygenase [Amycolatopsis sp. NPDC059090]|uniref:nitric oxide synthase oxygenase n=1 Tax=Amycolatopsis sp. NPDC059090 TaxID=3346723 RepID=UPI00366E211C